MERAEWNNQVYYASEIAKSYELEASIRKASAKELFCPDPDCTKPILRYCHGEVKEPYFAHLDNCDCDYAKFDKGNTQLMRQVKRAIYDNFVARGYDVQIELKVLSRHYTHLLFTLQNGKKIAVELGTQRTTANEIEKLSDEYNKIGIVCKWIVISDKHTLLQEDKVFFLKRSQLNTNKYKDVLLLNWEGTELTQYVVDPYEYTETASLTDLTFEDAELTIKGFYKRCADWAENRKKEIYEQEKRRQERAKEIRAQEERRKAFEKEWEQLAPASVPSVSKNNRPTNLNDFRSQLLNSKESVYFGAYPLRLCLHCDNVKKAMWFDPFIFYEKNKNLGICKECKKNNVPKKED